MPPDASPLLAFNLALRFAIELAAFAALGYWGAQAGTSTTVHIVLAAAAPLAAIVVWSLFVAPKRVVDVSEPVRLVVELVVFGAAAVALVAAGHAVLAIVFAVVAVTNSALVRFLAR